MLEIFNSISNSAPATYWLIGVFICAIIIVQLSRIKVKLKILVQSLLSTLLSAQVSYDTINSKEELARVSLGWPVRFLVQNQQRFDPPFPYNMGVAWEVSTRIKLVEFIMCWAIYFLVFYGVHRVYVYSLSE